MAYIAQLGKLGWRYNILLLLCLSLLVRPHIHWKTQGTVRTSKAVSVVSRQTILAAKDWQSPNLTQSGIYKSNDMETRAYTCCAGANWKLVSFSDEICEGSPFLESCKPVEEIMLARVSTVCMDPTTSS